MKPADYTSPSSKFLYYISEITLMNTHKNPVTQNIIIHFICTVYIVHSIFISLSSVVNNSTFHADLLSVDVSWCFQRHSIHTYFVHTFYLLLFVLSLSRTLIAI